VATAGPRRRRTDRGERPPALGPVPVALGPPDPAALVAALDAALTTARARRRPATLVCLAVPDSGGPELEAVAALARRTVRATDAMWRDGRNGVALLLADVDGPSSEPALARLRLRLRGRGMGRVAMGRAAPPPGVGARELLLLARADLRPISPP
jgi:hypothetical protein